jgi:hypothetical protein
MLDAVSREDRHLLQLMEASRFNAVRNGLGCCHML